MAKSRSKTEWEIQVEAWRNFGLFLLFLLGVVGAISYTLIIRQKTQINLQDQRIIQLNDSVGELEAKLNGGTAAKKK